MCKKIISEIKTYLEGNHNLNAVDFSLFLEDFLCDNYDEMYAENPKLTKLMNEELPEICATVEHGDDGSEFKRLLLDEIKRIGIAL